jgi:very-short-patch-repair endonuclease
VPWPSRRPVPGRPGVGDRCPHRNRALLTGFDGRISVATPIIAAQQAGKPGSVDDGKRPTKSSGTLAGMFPPDPARHAGVFTWREARAAGLSARQARLRVRRGDWTRVVGTSYLPAGMPVAIQTRCWAAVLDAGVAAVVSGPSGLALYGLESADARVHLSSLRIRPRGRPEVVVHQESVAEYELLLADSGLLVADRRRSLVDALRFLPLAGAQPVLDEALRQRWVDLDWLSAQASRFVGHRGAPQLARLVAAVRTNASYAGERRLHALLRGAGIRGWRANVAVHDAAGLVGYGDVVFADVPLVLEVDGITFHAAPDRFQADRRKQNRLVARGYVVLRFTWQDLTCRPEDVVAQVVAMIQRLQRLPA